MEQALTQGQREEHSDQTKDNCVPTLGLAALDCCEIPLHDTLITEGAKLSQLRAANMLAGA